MWVQWCPVRAYLNYMLKIGERSFSLIHFSKAIAICNEQNWNQKSLSAFLAVSSCVHFRKETCPSSDWKINNCPIFVLHKYRTIATAFSSQNYIPILIFSKSGLYSLALMSTLIHVFMSVSIRTYFRLFVIFWHLSVPNAKFVFLFELPLV